MTKTSTNRKTYKTSELMKEQPQELSESDEDNNIELSKPTLPMQLEAQPKKVSRPRKPKIIENEDHDDISLTPLPVKKTMSNAKAEAIKKAQKARQDQLKKKREDDEEAKRLIEKSYKAEVEQQLTKTLLPRYSKKIKKQILEKLKAQKIQELKKQYGYQTNSDSSDNSSGSSSSSEEEEEEVVIKRKKNNKKPNKKVYTSEPETVLVAKAKPQQSKVANYVGLPNPLQESKPVGILDKFRSYGF